MKIDGIVLDRIHPFLGSERSVDCKNKTILSVQYIPGNLGKKTYSQIF